jgi:hypothetical protein
MTIPDSQMGLNELFASRMEKQFEAEARCSFCGRASPKVRSLIKSIGGQGVCNTCLDALLAVNSDFYAPNSGGSDQTCLFCERLSFEVHRMVKLDIADSAICSDCVIACLVNLREYEAALAEAGMEDSWDMGGALWD